MLVVAGLQPSEIDRMKAGNVPKFCIAVTEVMAYMNELKKNKGKHGGMIWEQGYLQHLKWL